MISYWDLLPTTIQNYICSLVPISRKANDKGWQSIHQHLFAITSQVRSDLAISSYGLDNFTYQSYSYKGHLRWRIARIDQLERIVLPF